MPCRCKSLQLNSFLLRRNSHGAGLVRICGKRSVHKPQDVGDLLNVPRYSDLLDDIDHEDESERGRLLVTNPEGWRTEMARWIGEARQAEIDEANEEVMVDENLDLLERSSFGVKID
ncbi:hypothetical protein K435DRAFT_809510 [Dendrothele bispora CBS 962.96]|uniref:Uncharacterized protein n=1 Tax=Dendrothele bispora (strain CBS 962.96) TaxID=1314807 RepID=A0A4S8KYE6_DENBC|nr:hypothetical protein K435DRAFT_809510 [Dendrothele bispora CBS 962.96]